MQALIEAEAEVDMMTTIVGDTPEKAEMIVVIGRTIKGKIEKELIKGLMIGSIVRKRMTDIIRFMMTRSIEILVVMGG